MILAWTVAVGVLLLGLALLAIRIRRRQVVSIPDAASTARTIAELLAQGAYVVFDNDHPEKPVIELELSQRTTFDLRKVRRTLPRLIGLTQLRTLTLGTTAIRNADLALVHHFPQLRSLNLGACRKIGDAGVVHLRGLTQLHTLNLGYTRVTDRGLVHVKELATLECLMLYRNRVTDEGLRLLIALPKLRSLNVNLTRVTDAGVREFQQARPEVKVER